MLELKSISKKYNDFEALKPLSIAFKPQGITAVLGANGAGKSTCLKIMSSVIAPSTGLVALNQKDLEHSSYSIKNKIVYLPEKHALESHLTLREACFYRGKLRGLSSSVLEEKVQFALERADLQDLADQTLKTFSEGMRQRASIAIALVSEAEFFILDEPAKALDPIQQKWLWDLLLDLAKTAGVIFSTHSLEEASKIADRVLIFSQGELLSDTSIPFEKDRREKLESLYFSVFQKQSKKRKTLKQRVYRIKADQNQIPKAQCSLSYEKNKS